MDERTSAIALPSDALWLLGLGGVLLFLVGMFRWRSMLLPFFVILYIEGLFRNLLDTPAVLLVKDVLLAGIYAGFLLYALKHRRWLALPVSLGLPLACFFALSVLQMFNPALESLAIGLVGLKTYFYYLPLMLVIPAVLRTERDLFRFLTALLLLAIPVAAYGIVQYFQGPEAYAALGPAFRRATFVVVGEFYEGAVLFRPSSTFSWPSNFAVFLFFSTLVAVVAVHLHGPRHLRRTGWLALPVVLIATVLSGQRGLYVLLPATLLLALFVVRSAGAILRTSLALIVIGLGLYSLAPPAILGRFATILFNEGGVIGSRLEGGWGYLARALLQSPLGRGTGSSALGTRYITTTGFVFTESQFARVASELGMPGLLTFLWLYLALLWYSWCCYRRIQARDLRYIGGMVWAVLATLVAAMYLGNTLDIPVASVFFWTFLGIHRMLLEVSFNKSVPYASERALSAGVTNISMKRFIFANSSYSFVRSGRSSSLGEGIGQ